MKTLTTLATTALGLLATAGYDAGVPLQYIQWRHDCGHPFIRLFDGQLTPLGVYRSEDDGGFVPTPFDAQEALVQTLKVSIEGATVYGPIRPAYECMAFATLPVHFAPAEEPPRSLKARTTNPVTVRGAE